METEVAAPPPPPPPLFKKRGPKANQIRKRPATPPPATSDSESGYTSTEDEGRRIKRRKKTALVTATSKDNPTTATTNPQDLSATKHAADHTTHLTSTASNEATKSIDWYDDKDPATTSQPPNKSLAPSNPPPTAPKPVGPVKGSTNVRTTTFTDFAPDVCKDYKQTGFCGFGDNCKYLHAREDYKHGWELDREWENVGAKGKVIDGRREKGGVRGWQGGKGKKKNEEEEGMDEEEVEAALLEKIPFACVICKEGYKHPVVTRCGHYFCEGCALRRYKRNPACASCGAGTGGVFNGAKQLERLLERKRERGRVRRERALAAGEEVSEEEGAEGGDGEGRKVG